MPITKSFKVSFFTSNIPSGCSGHRTLSSLLEEQYLLLQQNNGTSTRPQDIGSVQYEIRELMSFASGASFKGIFAKIRKDDIAHIGKTGGVEREIDLDDDEGLIEKNYFLFDSDQQLLTYQINGHGSPVEKLAEYLSSLLGTCAVSFNPVVKADSLQKLMRDEFTPVHLELKVAKPTNPALYPADDWSRELLNMINSADGANAHIMISTEGRGVRRRSLATRIKNSVNALVDSGLAEIARVTVKELEHPIDLIMGRVIASQKVTMIGRYPESESMYAALRNAKVSVNDDLEEIFGRT